MTDVVSFRPTPQEAETIERIRRAHGFKSRAEAVRYLVREGTRRAADWKDDPLYQFELPRLVRRDEDVSSKDINRTLYGGD